MNKIREILSNTRNRHITFAVMLFIALLLCGVFEELLKDPTEPHLWRSSDCISIADNYAKGNGFFSPEMNCQISDHFTSGKTVAEFPIVYYIIGKIWAFTGKQYWIYRCFTFLISVIALIFLYRIALRITKNWFWSALTPLLLLASPIFAYYSAGFITNIYALDLDIISIWFFLEFLEKRKLRQLLWCSLLITLAGLLKTSALILYIILLVILVADLFGLMKQDGRKIFERKMLCIVILLIPLLINALWYIGFVEYYCGLHGGRYSFTSPFPSWSYSATEQSQFVLRFEDYTMLQVYPSFIWLFSTISLLYLAINFRSVNRLWLIVLPLLVIGEFCFAHLFYFCLDGHDYYFCDLLVFFVLNFIALVYLLSKKEKSFLRSPVGKFIGGAFMLYALLGSGAHIHMHLYGVGTVYEKAWNETFATKSELEDFAKFQAWTVNENNYKTLNKELSKRGFDRNVKVFCASDPSFNNVLNILDRKGFSDVAGVWNKDSVLLSKFIQNGAELMFVDEPQSESRKNIKALMGYKLFQYWQIGVYDLRPYKK